MSELIVRELRLRTYLDAPALSLARAVVSDSASPRDGSAAPWTVERLAARYSRRRPDRDLGLG